MEDLQRVRKLIDSARTIKALDDTYKKYLGRKGSVALALRKVGKLPKEERAKKARSLQALKKEIEREIQSRAEELRSQEEDMAMKNEWIDVSAPGKKTKRGHLHPLTQIQQSVNEIFTSLGFEIAEGPEVETEWYNFDALNIPSDHPARDMWDTFWLRGSRKSQIPPKESDSKSDPTGQANPPETRNQSFGAGKSETITNDQNSKHEKLLLRTHTSPVQIRYMKKHQPPLRIIAPGRVFRYEASDASHDIQFYQVEGLMIDKDISVSNFKAVINEFLKGLFGENVKIRLRPSYFPFVEPGFEIDMNNGTGWLEIMGAGMVHPNVFKAAGYNSKDWQGFAFGIGIDRIAMMKYKIDDIRLFYGGDLRFLKQF